MTPPHVPRSLALVLGGGGARGAYQAGVVRVLARRHPNLRIQVLVGISAGAVNTIHLAAHTGTLTQSADALADLWLGLTPEQVYDVRSVPLLWNLFRWSARLASGGVGTGTEPMKGMMDTAPLRQFLTRSLVPQADGSITGIETNIAAGRLRAVALSATSYTTGQSVTWVEGSQVELWQRPQRRSETARLGVEHVMASSALPMIFPAVRVGEEWYGDGGVRLTAPLSPALHLGATHILTISTRYRRSLEEANSALTTGYPPPAQVLGVLYNAVFLDLIDEDIVRLQKVNHLLTQVPPERRDGMRIAHIMVIRPSRDLGKLAGQFEARLPGFLKYLTRGLGTRETKSPDFLSLILFQRDYIAKMIELGEQDAEAQGALFDTFLAR
jgi:NTE family protein